MQQRTGKAAEKCGNTGICGLRMQFVPFFSTACAGSENREQFYAIIRLFKGYIGGVILKKLQSKFMRVLAFLALGMAVKTANAACVWFTYQPELPEQVRKLRKF